MMDWQRLSPEQELLIRCSSVEPAGSSRKRIGELAAGPIDEEYLLEQARRHGLAGLVYEHLQGTPARVTLLEELRGMAQQITIRNLQCTRELVRVTRLLEEAAIRVMPFKGPLLTDLAYGNPSFRTYADMDLLVRREDLWRTKCVLEEVGYRPAFDLTAEQKAERVEAQVGYELVREVHGLRFVVELHWSFLNTVHHFQLDPEAAFERAQAVILGGQSVLSMAPEDLLLYLTAHGSKHYWERLKWIADLDALIRSCPALDWTRAFERAEMLGSIRMVNLGLYLAAELLETPLPRAIKAEVYADAVIPELAGQITGHWLFRPPGAPKIHGREALWFLMRTRERWQDNIPLLKHNAKLLLKPSQKDREVVSLPQSLSALYYLIRPIRILKQRLL